MRYYLRKNKFEATRFKQQNCLISFKNSFYPQQ